MVFWEQLLALMVFFEANHNSKDFIEEVFESYCYLSSYLCLIFALFVVIFHLYQIVQ